MRVGRGKALIVLCALILCFSSGSGSQPEDCRIGDETCKSSTKRQHHRSLKAALADFPQVQRRMLELASNPETRSQARFVVFRVCCGELGNRLLGLTSSLLVALLTGRGLIIDWPAIDGFSGDSYQDLFQTPKGLSTPPLFTPLLTQWRLPVSQLTALTHTLELNNGGPEPFGPVLCQDLNEAFSDVVFLTLVTNQYFAPALRSNQHHSAAVEALFKKGEAKGHNMFSQLAQYVARPNKEIMSEIRAFKRQNFAGKRVVSMQVRRQNRAGRDKEGAGTTEAHVQAYWSCALSEQAHHENGTVYFVATDDATVREKAQEALGGADQVVYYDRLIETSADGMRSALIDLWLLGEADAIVTTSGSTFGYVAHARRSLTPSLVTLEKERGKKPWAELAWAPPRCVKARASEPCFHVWPMMLAHACYKGGYEGALAEWGQDNCRPWDMEMINFG